MARVPTIFIPGALMDLGGGDPFLNLHREMNRLFDDVIRGGGVPAGSAGGGQASMLLAPHMDVSETDGEIRIQAEMPGVTEQDIDVSLNQDVLTIRGEKKQERKEERQGVHFTERNFGTFQRSLRLPFSINPDQVQARFENGVLTVTLPKGQPQEQVRRIQVQGSQQAQAGIGQHNVSPAQQGSQGTNGGGQQDGAGASGAARD
ncbi:Hsp20/alpha crystallin family protein [Pseudoroseomonas wenyumeiae]|uniref:Hsp20/alpha crystallin family protein n=1 Tax=Teichococcus wenyumeiae TaxID=2478470 RepID=A0A3A9JEP3_9PROT|nr:Hsp20/alpha crystallin family protein [Pseudoroseomonas wenyumeiae]RKK03841.1 Hsp20/alpha crystallin family protein [Pseudoroseomonas wenyumeiae]RMI14531.1 Hsp20/alpha crystallin family protein [Pseudoroseomonas wenyumeiae]